LAGTVLIFAIGTGKEISLYHMGKCDLNPHIMGLLARA
jgi:hypothetical protein